MENKNLFKAALRGRYSLKHEMAGVENTTTHTANRVYRTIFLETARDYLKEQDAAPEIAQCFLLLPALTHIDLETVERDFGPKVAMLAAEMHTIDDNTDPQSLSRSAFKVFDLYEDGKARSMQLIISDLADLATAQHEATRTVAQMQARVERMEMDVAAMAQGVPAPRLH